MDALKFSIDDIPAQGLNLSTDVSVADVQPADSDTLPVETFSISGVLKNVGGEYLFQGDISGVFEQACDRCLENLKLPFSVEITWMYEQGNPDAYVSDDEEEALEENAVFHINGGVIDLAPQIWEELVLTLPSKFVCDLSDSSECPYYNAPLDATSGDDEGDVAPKSQFEALKDLLPELEQKRLEE